MNEHTQGPWRNEEQSVYGEGDSYIGYLEDFSDEDARRVVACVNACSDINIDVLERPAQLGKTIQGYFEKRLEMRSEIATLKAQRDDLRIHCDGWEKQYRVLESSFFALKEQRDELLSVLNKLRIDHYQCEDGYYSCPKSGDCPNSNPNDDCNCGADDHNAVIDATIAKATT